MALVVRIFEDTERGTTVLVTTKKRPHNKCLTKVIRKGDGKALRGLLGAMVEYDGLVEELDLVAQTAFDLGREYADRQNKKK